MKKQKNAKKIRLSRETLAIMTTTTDDNKAVRGGFRTPFTFMCSYQDGCSN